MGTSQGLDDAIRAALIDAACRARLRAYAPYSKFLVGAALRSVDGEIFVGCNVENASYGLTICAERTALTSAVAAGKREFDALALAMTGGGTPCGACRQVLAEFAPDLPILLVPVDESGHVSGRVTETTLTTLLPGRFVL
jgi:cytidine deaminase